MWPDGFGKIAEFVTFWVDTGGPIVVLLGLISVASLVLITVKAAQVIPALAGRAGRAAALEAWADGAPEDALGLVAAGRSPADRVVAVAMRGLTERREAAVLRDEIERAGVEELNELGRHIRLLEIIAMISPLLGLLGTVLGMIDAFRSLELAQGAANASVLAGGVWTALLTTAMGLIVAIPAGAAAGLLWARIDQIGNDIETTVARLSAAERARIAQ